MPQLRNLSVHITDAEGQELEEWAVQHFPKHSKVSAYIKAQSNLTFQVAVQAKIPYVDEDIASQRTEHSDADGAQCNARRDNRRGITYHKLLVRIIITPSI